MRIHEITPTPEKDDDKPPVVLWYLTDDKTAKASAEGVIEEGHTLSLDARYSARYDIAKQPNQKNHTHVFLKGNEVCVVNRDGTPSHGSPPFSSLPTKIQNKIKQHGLVEARAVLAETASGKSIAILPRPVMLRLWMALLVGTSDSGG